MMRNAQWLNAEHTAVDLEIQHPVYGWIPFTARADDPTTSAVFAQAAAGQAGIVAEYVAPTPDVVRAEIVAQISALERQAMLPRVTREFMLAYMEAAATPEQLALNIGYTRVKAFDQQIATLRAQL